MRSDGRLERVLAVPAARALRAAQARLDPDNMPTAPLAPEPPPQPAPPVRVVRPVAQVRFKADNFSYQTLAAGDSLVVELYGLQPGASLGLHRHQDTEHVLTILAGAGKLWLGERCLPLAPGDTALIPAGVYHSIENDSPAPIVVQQVSAPKPWDARFGGPHPRHPDGRAAPDTSDHPLTP